MLLTDLARQLDAKYEPRRIGKRFQKIVILEYEKALNLLKDRIEPE